MTKVAVFVGSIKKDSLNRKLAQAVEKLAPKDITFEYVDISKLPLYNEDLEADFPTTARKLKESIEAADGVLFVTPEYNRGIPGVLKNAIDWASRPWQQSSFEKKPAAIIGASPTPNGTNQAQQQLRNVVLYLNMKLLGQPEVYFNYAAKKFNERGELVEEARDELQQFATVFSEWVEKNRAV